MRTSRFTSFQGNESFPAFSPDGTSVAFSWNGPDQSNMDIYVKGRAGQDTTRLTTHPSPDYSPAWSSDGRYIAFVRPDPEKLRSYDLYVLPSAGGREEKLGNIYPFGAIPQLSWSRDDAFIYFSRWSQPSESVAVFRVNVESREVEQITFPPVEDVGDFSPGISPDGKHLAYIRRRMRGNYDIYVQDLDAKTTRQVSREATEIQGYTWAGVSNILFAANLDGTSGLWKTKLDGKEPQKVLSGTVISHPSYSSASKSLVYKEHGSLSDIWRLDLKDPGKQQLLITSSSSVNVNPQISPDGQRMVFSSNRTGTHNIWMSKVDGSEQTQLTFFDKYVRAGMARWSPVDDKVLIYFGRFQSYVMNMTTGQLVTMEYLDANPIWAKNGMDFYSCTYPETNLYFVSRDGSEKTRLTNDHGYYAELEGDYLYYFKHFDQREIWRIALDGSNEEPVLQGVERLGISTWEVVPEGLYFFHSNQGTMMLYFYHFESKEIREICPLPGASSFTIDPEERYALYSKASSSWSDLILVEHVHIE
jgi:Tol biopolymer transport system component